MSVFWRIKIFITLIVLCLNCDMRPLKALVVLLSLAFLTGCTDYNNLPIVIRYDKTIVVDGFTRSYTVVLPSNYYESDAFSLAIGMHGCGGSSV